MLKKRCLPPAFLSLSLSLSACGGDEPPVSEIDLSHKSSDVIQVQRGEIESAAPASGSLPAGTEAEAAGAADMADEVAGAEVETGVLQQMEPWTGDFDGMAKRRVIRVLTTFNKTQFFLDEGQPRGATYEALKLFEEAVNKRLGTGKLGVHVVIVPVARDDLLPAIEAGLGDIAAANLTITPERQESVDFSDPFISNVKELVVTGPGIGPVASLEDLAGREIHVRRSSSYYESLEALNHRLREQGLDEVQIREASEFLETEDLLEMVNAGLLPITIADRHLAEFWSQFFTKMKIHSDLVVREGGEIAWAYRKNSPKLAAVVNDFVKDHKKGTLLGNILFKRYLVENQWASKPLTDGDLGKLEALFEHFDRYGKQFDIDSLLVAAQAYQESGFDQSRRSKAGAVGVMQIKPSTAADPNVGVKNIDQLENNIHAGVKYLDFIRGRYYADGGLNDIDQVMLALAAYNAGPARISKLRQQAQTKGLDSNTWFRNVEQLAPRETVTYVSNIYKYYITYREHMRQLAEKQMAKN